MKLRNIFLAESSTMLGKYSKCSLAKEEKKKYDIDVFAFLVYWNQELDIGDRSASTCCLCDFIKLKLISKITIIFKIT